MLHLQATSLMTAVRKYVAKISTGEFRESCQSGALNNL